jgi:two-component system phosphate regulon sensor histidine kinase PhoR
LKCELRRFDQTKPLSLLSSLRKRAFYAPLAFLLLALVVLHSAIVLSFGTFQPALIWIEAIIVLLAIPSAYIHSKRLVKPIGDLLPQAAEVSNGRLEVSNHGQPGIPDELRLLTKAINQISEKQAQDLARMQKLERVRSEFLGNVSHELRTPIFAVQGFIETLLEGALEDPSVNRDFLERAQAQAARLNALLNDLIDISRIESGEMRMSFRVFDIQPFLRDLVLEMQPLAKQSAIDLFFTGNVLPHHEVEIFGDKERIKQVMINLIDNAIKYTNPGGTVKIELHNNEPDERSATISVSDTGIGIGSEHLPRLFERFYRVDKDRSRLSPGGTGLGLAICKHIIEAHGSHISVSSEPGKGSTFSFVLHKDVNT